MTQMEKARAAQRIPLPWSTTLEIFLEAYACKQHSQFVDYAVVCCPIFPTCFNCTCFVSRHAEFSHHYTLFLTLFVLVSYHI